MRADIDLLKLSHKPLAVGLMLGLLIVALIFSVATGPTCSAEAVNALKISPTRTEVLAEPGQSITVKVVVTNTTDQHILVRPVQNDFVAGDEFGSPAIFLEETEFAPSHSLKDFMQPIDDFALAGKETKTVNATIIVPESAEAGGYFGALRFAPVNPNDNGQVNMNMSLASLILLTVNGDIPEKLVITNFSIEHGGRPGAIFTGSDGIKIITRFQNHSQIHLSPFGKIIISKGKEVVFDHDFNGKEQKDYILPNSGRKWELPIDGLEGFGRYTVNAIFTYGSNNQTIEVVKTFWIIPTNVIIIGLAGVVGLIAFIVWWVLSIRRRKRKISF